MNRGRLFILLCALCCVAAAAQFRSEPVALAAGQTIQGTVVGIGGRMAGRTAPFRLNVSRYTSADDVSNLNSALRSGGQDALMNTLSKLDAGRIAIGNNVGVTANAIIATPTAEGGTKLTVLYQRNVSFYELRYGARSEDYRFGYAEIYLDRRGQGQGTLIPAAKVRLEGDNWVVEDFGEFPARLMGLRSSGGVGVAR
ncbi:MAG TPA: hypothetical protein VLJ61_11635 [Pyrinomonadaceae bacterium]|nr:hypothetical protein [Pyrinomonadaceae bacterium]